MQSRGFIGRLAGAVLLALISSGVLAGCAASRSQQRLKVAEAELLDQRHQNRMLTEAADQARLAQDRAESEAQMRAHEARVAQIRAEENERAVAALDDAASGNAALIDRIGTVEQRVDRVSRSLRDRPRYEPVPVPTPTPDPNVDYRESRQVEAFSRDLRAQLQRRGITGLPVEIRATQSGQRRVAIVLQNSFQPGKDSLAHNMDAVRAVVNLGRLIGETYPGSRVSIEGHTDSDPIRVSKWRDNEHLSLARAEEVRKFLAKAGVQERNITVSGLGARHPLESGNTDRAKARNRRVEIYIEPGA